MTEEAGLLHFRARERLRSAESDVQQGVQAVVDRTREKIFEMVREEVEAIFAELKTRLGSHLRDAELNVDREASAPGDGEEHLHRSPEPAARTRASQQSGDETADQTPEVGIGPQVVCLDLPPPLDLRSYLDFYRGLSRIKDIRILRAMGSVEGAVSVYVRHKEPFSLQQLLGALPGVSVEDGVSHTGGDKGEGVGEERCHLALRIRLTVHEARS